MAFFDDMKNKLAATSQNAVQKAKDLTETTRLNSQVNEMERSLGDLYRKLGFEIYQAYREKPMPEGEALMAQITELHGQIEALRNQIQTINRASLCPVCGAKITKGMVFCSGCGNRLPEVVESPVEEKQPMRCKGCGAPLKEGDLFCTNCGTRVEAQ